MATPIRPDMMTGRRPHLLCWVIVSVFRVVLLRQGITSLGQNSPMIHGKAEARRNVIQPIAFTLDMRACDIQLHQSEYGFDQARIVSDLVRLVRYMKFLDWHHSREPSVSGGSRGGSGTALTYPSRLQTGK
jgi:hypothetical protein